MDPREFLVAAEDMQNSCSEAKRRSAMSRGYYAVYHHVVAYLKGHEIFKEREQVTHGHLIKVLEEAAKHSARQAQYEKLGKKFAALERGRNGADYRLDKPGPGKETCVQFVNGCRNTIRDFDDCTGDDYIAAVQASPYFRRTRSP